MLKIFCLYFSLFIVFIVQPALAASSTKVTVQINSGNPVFPFPQFNAYQNPTGKLDNLATHNGVGVTHAEMEQTLRDAFQIDMNQSSYTGTTLNGIKYIKYHSDPDCSEGDGYGLLSAASMADKKTFDGMWLWIHDNAMNKVISYSTGQPTSPTYEYSRLPGWTNAPGANSATDGDVDIALALFTAYMQWGDSMGINDSKGNPILYKKDCIEFLKALNDTFSRAGKQTAYDCGDIGLDGYIKNGDTGNELTAWASNLAQSGFPKPPEYGGADMVYVDYSAPAYFHEFADFFSKEDPSLYAWNSKQFQRCEASCDWIMGQLLANPRMIPSAGHVTIGAGNAVTFTQMNEGEDFRLSWRTILNYVWHGNPASTWDPVAHQLKSGISNTYERDVGLRYGKFLWDTRQAPWNGACTEVPNAAYQYWGPPVLRWHYDVLGNPTGTFFLNWVPGTGAPSAVTAQDFALMAQLYRQCEIMWDADIPGDGYLTSVPHYYHGWFRLLGMLILSGNYQPPSTFKPAANMKVYMAIDKTFAFNGDSVTYTIDYRNYGSQDAQNVTIVDTLHKDFIFLSASNGGVFNSASNTVTWNIGSVAGFKTATGVPPTKGQAQLKIKVGIPTQNQYRNRATISCSNGAGWTSNEYPNNITAVMERNYLDIAKRALIIKQTASVPIAKAGTDVEFIINFENSSDAGWINGGRSGVHFAYAIDANKTSGPSKVMRFRLFNDADESYIDFGNYRFSYFMYDSLRKCYQGTAGCTMGWQVTPYVTEGLNKTYIKIFQENIMPGQDTLGKWNQRIVVQFSDPTNPSRVINLAATDVLLQQNFGNVGTHIHRGGGSPLRLIWDLHSDYNPPDPIWNDDWSWDPNAVDAEGGMYWPITNDWTAPDNPNIPVTTWNPNACSDAKHTVKNVLVEEWDGYTWRRVAGSGPMPGRDVDNVVIRDTIPAGFTFKEFTGSSPLGVAPKISGNVITWSIPKMQIKQKGTIVFTATASSSCPLKSKKVINRSWISADKESPFSDSAIVTLICDSNFVDIPPTKSTLALKGPNLETIGDTAKIDTTTFHVVVTDKDQDQNSKTRDTLNARITNPSGSDSIYVKLIETGEATGVFQTAVPISIISAASPGPGSNKIHMDPGDLLWVTYTDPGDSTDVSQAYLITLAAFPMPLRGWIIDANGDGAADSAIVIYNKPIVSPPDSLRFNFPDQAGSQTVKTGQGTMTALGNALAVSFAAPFEKNVTGFTNATQGNAMAFIMDGAVSRRIVFPLADSVGPVITAAQAVERLTPGIDTLFVTFSEAMTASSLKGASLILIQSAGATVITIDSARQLLPNRFAVSLSAGTPQPMPGDSLRINPAGPARDLAGNGAHERNPAVIITIKQVAPVIVSAWYVDRDINGADGFVDTAFVRFNKKVNLAELAFMLDWGNGLTQGGIKGDALSFAVGDSVVAIALQPSFPYAKYIRTSGNIMATPSFTSFPGELNSRPITDSAAPVIESATYYPNTSANDACDTLLVGFSEPVVLGSDLKHFVFSGRTGISYEYDLSPDSIFGDKAWFCIKFTSDLAPRTGDSICINANSSVRDDPGIFQNNPRNRKVALKIMAGPSNLLISILKNPFSPNLSVDSLGITDKGTAITISSKRKNASIPDVSQASLTIYDALGNRVHTDRFVSNGGRIAGNSYYFIWDGYNTNRRAVGAGIYIAVVAATEGSGASTKKTIKIGLKR